MPGGNCTLITGTASKSGQTITYTITNAVNVPAGTKIRLEFANINNPLNPSANYKVTVTTRNVANTVLDGPTQSNAYTVKQIGTNAIADDAITNSKLGVNAVSAEKISSGAITSDKPSTSYQKLVILNDDVFGNARGWNPNGVINSFTIIDPDAHGDGNFQSFINIEVLSGNGALCGPAHPGVDGLFTFSCNVAPLGTATIRYMVTNLIPVELAD